MSRAQDAQKRLSNGVRQVRQLSTRRRLHPAKSRARSIRAIDVDTIETCCRRSSWGCGSSRLVVALLLHAIPIPQHDIFSNKSSTFMLKLDQARIREDPSG